MSIRDTAWAEYCQENNIEYPCSASHRNATRKQ